MSDVKDGTLLRGRLIAAPPIKFHVFWNSSIRLCSKKEASVGEAKVGEAKVAKIGDG